jgi:hypothetical protein
MYEDIDHVRALTSVVMDGGVHVWYLPTWKTPLSVVLGLLASEERR